MSVEFKPDLSGFTKPMAEIARRQIPFAMAQALTITAGHVGVAWQEEIASEFDRPTPFTINSVAVRPARKSNLVATVYVKDIAAEYLEPYVVGGPHSLGGKRGLLTPKNVTLNAYGNLTRNKMAQLKAKSGVFVGAVEVKGKSINGVWQRLKPSRRRPAGRRTVVKPKAEGGPAALKLLIRFSDPLPVKQDLRFYDRAAEVVPRVFAQAFAEAFERAMATAR